MGRDAAISPPSASAKLLGQFDILLLFDSAADGDDDFRLGQIHGLFGFLENLVRLVADELGDVDVDRLDRRAAAPASALSPRNAPF